jgi:hypothetical protein
VNQPSPAFQSFLQDLLLNVKSGWLSPAMHLPMNEQFEQTARRAKNAQKPTARPLCCGIKPNSEYSVNRQDGKGWVDGWRCPCCGNKFETQRLP